MKKTIVLTALLTCLLTFSANAAPACKEPTEYTQPNGSVIELYTYGDEHFSFTGDSEGYMLVRTNGGQYEYVTQGKSRGTAPAGCIRPFNAVKGFDMRPDVNAATESCVEISAVEIKQNGIVSTSLPASNSSVAGGGSGSSSKPSYLETEFTPLSVPKQTPMLVVAVEFSDVKLSDAYYSGDAITDKFFSLNDGAISVNSYYNEASDGFQTFVPAFNNENKDVYLEPVEEYVDSCGEVIGDGIIKVSFNYERPLLHAYLEKYLPENYNQIENPAEKQAAMNQALADYNAGSKEEENNKNNLIADAMSVADDIIDFAAYSNGVDENGMCCVSNDELIVCFIIAGYETSADIVKEDSIWAHSGGLDIYTNDTVEWEFWLDNPEECDEEDKVPIVCPVHFAADEYEIIGNTAYLSSDRYALVGAMYNPAINDPKRPMLATENPMTLGTFCHEIGHVLGLPDLYYTGEADENGNKPDYGVIDTLSLMSDGNWCKEKVRNLSGSMPSHPDAWSKLYLGWYNESDLKVINYDMSESVNILAHNLNEDGYKYVIIKTTDENEYYIIENRELIGYDRGLAGYNAGLGVITEGGIAIYRIDNDIIYEKLGGYDDRGRLYHSKINNIETPGIKLIRYGEQGDGTIDTTKQPLWKLSQNYLPLFSNNSMPKNSLNTYTDNNSDSGVVMQFVGGSSDKMRVKFGEATGAMLTTDTDGNTAVNIVNEGSEAVTYIPFIQKNGQIYTSEPVQVSANDSVTSPVDGNPDLSSGEYTMMFIEKSDNDTILHIHNNTNSPLSITPIITLSSGEIYSFPTASMGKNGSDGISYGKPVINDGNSYKIFTFDFKTMKPMMKAAEIDLTE